MLESFYDDFQFDKTSNDTTNNSFRQIQVINTQFLLKGTLKYPHPFSVSYYDSEKNIGHSSYPFFIEEGTINIELSDLAKSKSLGTSLNSKANHEYSYLKALYSNSQDTITGKVYNMPLKLETLYKYIVKNPSSYVALWDIILNYRQIKTTSEIESALNLIQLFSDELKKTKTYLALLEIIQHDLEYVPGKIFPNIELREPDSLYNILRKNKFVLIDFWFSGCQPCVAQFPYYKNIYSKFRKHQFEIVGISVDSKKEIEKWQNIIKKLKLQWLQYLDQYAKNSNSLFIYKFPTNFLLNEKGEIIWKDISPKDLDSFLQKNLNSHSIKK